jgi:hypothetical protein
MDQGLAHRHDLLFAKAQIPSVDGCAGLSL